MVSPLITADLIIKDLEDTIYKDVVINYGDKIAKSCAEALFQCLYLNFKNQLMYIPVPKNHNDIYQDFINNYSYQDLAFKYNRSVQNIYAITKILKKQYIIDHQSDIFPLPGDQKKTRKPTTILILESYLPSELIQCGLEEKKSKEVSKKILNHICSTYPGVQITISIEMKNDRSTLKKQTSIF